MKERRHRNQGEKYIGKESEITGGAPTQLHKGRRRNDEQGGK